MAIVAPLAILISDGDGLNTAVALPWPPLRLLRRIGTAPCLAIIVLTGGATTVFTDAVIAFGIIGKAFCHLEIPVASLLQLQLSTVP